MAYLPFITYSILFILIVVGLYFIYKQLRTETNLQQEQIKNQQDAMELVREELSLVKKEIQLNSDEMLYNRMVPIIYHQLKRFEEAIALFSFEGQKGKDGINYLIAKIDLKQTEVYSKDRHISEQMFESIKVLELKQLIAYDALADLAFESAKNVNAVRTVLENSTCSIDQKEALKTLFLDNISNRYFQFIKKVLEISRKRMKDVPSEKEMLLFQKETFLKDREVVKNFKVMTDFKKHHTFNIES